MHAKESIGELTDDGFVQLLQKVDEEYRKSQKRNLDIDAMRVEQGEYVVLPLAKKLGTYNVNQCVIIYARNAKDELHGLAHIDGHTEIRSLEIFFEKLKFNSSQNNIEIQLFGANGDAILLNDPKLTGDKVRSFLKSKNIRTDNITDNTGCRDDNRAIDIVFNFAGKHYYDIPCGEQNTGRALHNLQALKRSNGYEGSYPLIEAFHEENKLVFLDKLAIKKLTSHNKGENKSHNLRVGGINSMTEEFEAAVPVIMKSRDFAVQGILDAVNAKNTIISDENKDYLKTIPIYIGIGSNKYNMPIIEALVRGGGINDIKIPSPPHQGATLRDAIRMARELDPKLNEQELIWTLITKYPKEYWDVVKLLDREYGVEIEIDHFLSALDKASPKLAALIVLQNFIEYPELGKHDVYTAVQAAYILNNNLDRIELLGRILEVHNAFLKMPKPEDANISNNKPAKQPKEEDKDESEKNGDDFIEALTAAKQLKEEGKDESEKNERDDFIEALTDLIKDKITEVCDRNFPLRYVEKVCNSCSKVREFLEKNGERGSYTHRLKESFKKHKITDESIITKFQEKRERSNISKKLSMQNILDINSADKGKLYKLDQAGLEEAIILCGGSFDARIFDSFDRLSITKKLTKMIEKPLMATKIAYGLTYGIGIGMLVGLGSCISNYNLKKSFVTSTAIMNVAFCVTKLKIPIISSVVEYSANKVQSFIDRTRSCVAKQEQLQRT